NFHPIATRRAAWTCRIALFVYLATLRGGGRGASFACVKIWRGDRVAEGTRLLSGRGAKLRRGFESRPLRCSFPRNSPNFAVPGRNSDEIPRWVKSDAGIAGTLRRSRREQPRPLGCSLAPC